MGIEKLSKYLPSYIIDRAKQYGENIQEIRLTLGQVPMLYTGKISMVNGQVVTKSMMNDILSKMSGGALYAVQDRITQGYLTLDGGHRVGICGRIVMSGDKITALTDVTAISIRICREIDNISNRIMAEAYDRGVKNTLILGAPGQGKTTLLRSIIKELASAPRHLRVGVIDERNELSNNLTLNLGQTSFVIEGGTKSLGIQMVIRSMSPDVIAVDEVGNIADSEALFGASVSGCNVLCTMHASCLADAKRRSIITPLLQHDTFDIVIEVEKPNVYHIKRMRNDDTTNAKSSNIGYFSSNRTNYRAQP